MATTRSFTEIPDIIFDSEIISKALQSHALTPEVIRSDEQAVQALRNGEVSQTFLRTFAGLPFYMALTAPSEESSEIAFEKHFNPSLKYDSEYFKNLNSLIKCVENNASKSLSPEQQNEVCSKEMKQIRIAAFKKELLYHNVNKRFFMNLISMKRHEAPY